MLTSFWFDSRLLHQDVQQTALTRLAQCRAIASIAIGSGLIPGSLTQRFHSNVLNFARSQRLGCLTFLPRKKTTRFAPRP